MRLLITGGCGFIGSNFIKMLFSTYPDVQVSNLDIITYAGNSENLEDLGSNLRYQPIMGSIVDRDIVDVTVKSGVDAIINFAAETHVDRSLRGAEEFVRTNVQGTAVLLEAARRHKVKRFVQISTDEVYGSLPPEGIFTETTPLHPNNPYAATKAAADHMALAYARSFGMDVVITRSSNNYGPYQYPEKFVPLFITNALEDKPCPVYGDGLQIRDWLHVGDNCRGILAVLEKGKAGEIYNLGGGNERPNIEVAKAILKLVGKPEKLLQTVPDRPGHDRRYALDSSKARNELGWAPQIPFQKGLKETVRWYCEHRTWANRIREGEFKKYYEKQYGIPGAGARG